MPDFKKYYKKPPSTFGNTKKIRAGVVHEKQVRRKTQRTHDIEDIRVETSPCSCTPLSQNDNFRKKLLDRKTEQKKEKQSGQKKKPPFVVGIVHHRIYSPPPSMRKIAARTIKTVLPAQINSNIYIIKGITRATQKRLLAKAARAETKQLPSATTSATSNDQVKSDINRRKSFAPDNHKFNPPTGLPEVTLCEGYFVVGSSLKRNISEHDKSTEIITEKSDSSQKLSEASGTSRTSDKVATNGAVIENSAVPIEEKKYSVEYFKRVSDEEKNRLQNLCDEWIKIQSQHEIPEDIRNLINQTVGQTTMLIKEKFKQFHILILDCERKDGDILITCMDLHGFWDLVYIAIKDCNARFEKLKALRTRGWQEDKLINAQSTKQNIVMKKKAKRSSLRASTLFDKNKRMSQIQVNDKNSQVINNQCVTPFVTKRATKVFRKSTNVMRNSFLKVHTSRMSKSNMYTSTPIVTTTSNSLSQFSTPLITMKVSQLYNKSMLNDTMHTTPKQVAITRENSMVKLPTNDSLSRQLTYEKSLEISSKNLVDSSKETNRIEPVSIEDNKSDERLNSEIECSVQTVIEKRIKDKGTTFVVSSSYNTDLSKTPEENIRSFEKSLSNGNLQIKLTVNNLSTPHNGSLIHNVSNISLEVTSTTDRVSQTSNSNIKS